MAKMPHPSSGGRHKIGKEDSRVRFNLEFQSVLNPNRKKQHRDLTTEAPSKMVHKTAFWSALLPLLVLVGRGSGDGENDKAEGLIGVLGESVTFTLKVSEPFATVSFLRSSRNDFALVALLKPEGNCTLTILRSAFEGRLNVSKDCKRIQLNHLRQEDSGRYKAEIQRSDKKEQDLFFNLQVYKRLSRDDLEIRCDRTGNGTWRLNCSAGEWEDGVGFGMASGSQREAPGRTWVAQQDLKEGNLTVTCRAENPVGSATRMEPLSEICAGKGNSSANPSKAVVAGSVVAAVLILCIACCVGFMCWRTKKKGAYKNPPSPEGSNLCPTIYSQIGGDPEGKTSPRTKPAKEKTSGPQTIYTTVNLPYKPNPLQTDDEKIQKGRRGGPEPGKKTVYSEIARPSESEDQSLKTVYETVKNPGPPKEKKNTKAI